MTARTPASWPWAEMTTRHYAFRGARGKGNILRLYVRKVRCAAPDQSRRTTASYNNILDSANRLISHNSRHLVKPAHR